MVFGTLKLVLKQGQQHFLLWHYLWRSPQSTISYLPLLQLTTVLIMNCLLASFCQLELSMMRQRQGTTSCLSITMTYFLYKNTHAYT